MMFQGLKCRIVYKCRASLEDKLVSSLSSAQRESLVSIFSDESEEVRHLKEDFGCEDYASNAKLQVELRAEQNAILFEIAQEKEE